MSNSNYSIRWVLAAMALAVQHNALADCAGASVDDVKLAFAQGQQFESQGKNGAALGAYFRAQEYTCDKNPVEAEAAKRAAVLSLPLAQTAEQRGDFERASRLYEEGGHYAKADAALMTDLRSKPDDPRAFENARSHFENRASESFPSNNAVRLKVTGEYRVNAKFTAELLTIPSKGVERALQQDAAAFNEQYLREYVQLIQARPDSPLDMAGMQAAGAAHGTFAQKWPDDLLKKSRDTLSTLRQWGTVARDTELAKSAERSYAQRIEQHVDTLTQRYNGAPKLLEAAIDYAYMLNRETALNEPRAAKIKAQAVTLGDAASSKQRYMLATEYYDAGDDRAKEQAARSRMEAAARAQLQPSMDAMQRQAEAIKAQYSDPEYVKALKAQAEAMKKNLPQQQAGAKQGKSSAELERELGL